MTYTPYDIQPPRECEESFIVKPFDHVYNGTLGKCEYERVAQRLVFDSQGWGEWVKLSIDDFFPLFSKNGSDPQETLERTQLHVREMVARGMLKRDGDEYSLSDEAIKRLVERFPART